MMVKLRRAGRRIRYAVRPLARVTDPPTTGVSFTSDQEITMADGVVLRADVFRPTHVPRSQGTPGRPPRHPVILCAHPYGKDTRPKRRRRGWAVPAQFRLLTQDEPFTISAWTSWEAPDPVRWCRAGYAVVNLDLRGWGRSEGVGELLSEQEGRDIAEVIAWIADQPWSTGRVAMSGVSYLALSQWNAAAQRPPALAAIVPWEGFTDLYRDHARPGGIREDGFLLLWQTVLRLQRRSPVRIRREVRTRLLVDDWWAARNRDIERIDVPALVCGSFSDHCLHSRGSLAGYERIGSSDKYLYTHRGPKWATYYGDAGFAAQKEFLDTYLKGLDTGLAQRPRVRVEVRERRRDVVAVHHSETWPPDSMDRLVLHLDASSAVLAPELPSRVGIVEVDRRREAVFAHRFDRTTDVVGAMRARLSVSIVDGADAHCFVGVRKVSDGRVVGFEGSYGFGDDLVAHGMLRVALRSTPVAPVTPSPDDGAVAHVAGDPGTGTAISAPFHAFDRVEPVRPGEIVTLDIELHASATRFRAGDELQLVVRGSWFFPTNPLTGQFPARYPDPPRTTCRLHTGPETGCLLRLTAGPPLGDDRRR